MSERFRTDAIRDLEADRACCLRLAAMDMKEGGYFFAKGWIKKAYYLACAIDALKKVG